MLSAGETILTMNANVWIEDQERSRNPLGLFPHKFRRFLHDLLLLRLQLFKTLLKAIELRLITIVNLLGCRLELFASSGNLGELPTGLLVKLTLKYVHRVQPILHIFAATDNHFL